MADPMFMTLRLHDEEDTHMRQTSSRSTASRQAPPKITLLLLGDPRGGSQTTITADTPCTYEAAVNLAFDAFPYALQPFQRSELSFALTRPRPGGGYMSHAPIRRKDDAWMDTMRHIAADQFVQVLVDRSRVKSAPLPTQPHRDQYSHTVSPPPGEKHARTAEESCGAVRRMMKSFVKLG